ncbi:MAG: serine/threonine-protein kinase [Acidimicrobiales bacterium]
MRDRSPRFAASIAEPETVAVRAPAAADATRLAPILDPTELFDPVSRPDAPTAHDGQLLADRYELGAVLGRGATGVVHRGRDRVLRREVAIKLLYPDLARERETSARFQQEAQLAARIHHPNAVAIFDTGVHDGQPFIVMECLPGETLATRISAHPLPVDEVCEIGAQLLSALDDAHKQGVIHRDIKPSNLLLTSTGSVKVADFGIATEADRHNLTSVGFVVGTIAYLAPERLRGVPATAQSDIYAAGVVLYEALTGRKPFAGKTAAEMLDQITHGLLTDIATLRPDIDPALEQVVIRALAKEPGARYASAADMAMALEQARATSARAASASPALPEPALAATTIIPLAEIGPEGARRRSLAFVAVIATLVIALGVGAFASRGGGLPTLSPTSTAPATGDVVAENPVVVPVVSTTVRPTTTRPAVTTAAERTTTKGKGKAKGG